jgi:hypothetical protein
MPGASKLNLTPIPPSPKTPGRRLARANADSPGLSWRRRQVWCRRWFPDYERGELRLKADMILRFATSLEVSTGDLLQSVGPRDSKMPGGRVLRRLERIEALPPAQQTARRA